MPVTTFYSYKGGLGRTLLLAWAARALARDGNRVVVIDFDLEAPGLPYKLGIGTEDALGEGLVGLLARFLRGDTPPSSLETWLRPVPRASNLWLLPAGPHASKLYWRSLAELSWERLFFDPDSQGARFFHWLNYAIERAVRPDHVLVDARTGVTEMGGAALALMADQVIALVGTSREGLYGTREVLRGVVTGPRAAQRGRPRIALALARMPASLTVDELQRLRRAVRDTICEDAEPLTATLDLELPLVIRSEPILQEDEGLALGNHDLRVHEDYRRVLDWLCGAAVPDEIPGLAVRAGAGVEVLRQTIALQRGLAERRPEEYLPDLAQALLSLGRERLGQGQRELGLAALSEAISIVRPLADKRPNEFEPELASTLSDVAIELSKSGRHEDALRKTLEATEILRRLAAEQPDTFRSHLAIELGNLSARHTELGRTENALQAALEATDLLRQLAQKDPLAFEPDLAFALSNLSVSLLYAGRSEGALAAAREAVSIRRRLAASRAETFEEALAGSLLNLSAFHGQLNDHYSALEAMQESVTLYRRLASERPEVFQAQLAVALNNLGTCLSRVDRPEEALQAAEAAAELSRRNAKNAPETFNEQLASALNNLSVRLLDLGRQERAVDASREAVELYRAMATTRPERFEPELANCLWQLGRVQEAIDPLLAAAALDEGLRLLLPYLRRIPAVHARTANGLARERRRLGSRPGAELDRALLEEVEKLVNDTSVGA